MNKCDRMATALDTAIETGSTQSQQVCDTMPAVPTSKHQSHSREKKLQITTRTAATSIERAKSLVLPKVASTNGSKMRSRFLMEAMVANELKEEVRDRFGLMLKRNLMQVR